MMAREAPQIVGEMIFNLADHHRYFRMLPDQWSGIFTEPAETIIDVLKTHAPMVKFKADDPYLKAIGDVIVNIEKELQGELQHMREQQEKPDDTKGTPVPGVIASTGPLSVVSDEADSADEDDNEEEEQGDSDGSEEGPDGEDRGTR